ncbi:MAG: S8 family serine peptidase [Sterolibacterium sp.]|jgi:subtilisin family serine protease
MKAALNGQPILVGVVDSGVAAGGPPGIVAMRAFAPDDGQGVRSSEPGEDLLGHGSRIAGLLLEQGGDIGLLVAQVFAATQTSSPQRVAAAIAWLVASGAALINMSVGVRRADAGLRLACERASAAGVILVASAPAQGAPVFPAAHPQCIAVSGDARCAEAEISWLDGANADFGAHPFASAGDARSGGASYAAARLSARIARLLSQGTAPHAIRPALRAQCRYHGPERRSA